LKHFHIVQARLPVPAVLLLALWSSLAGCGSRQRDAEVPSITTLAEDPILLSRVLERCNAEPSAAGTPECANARAAADRRFADDQAARARKAEADFELAREARRRADAATAPSQEASRQVDAYELPVEGAHEPSPPSP
jgi:hypothetical protein